MIALSSVVFFVSPSSGGAFSGTNGGGPPAAADILVVESLEERDGATDVGWCQGRRGEHTGQVGTAL